MSPTGAALRAILDAGFVFWGLFVAFVVLVVAYVLWMRWAEGRERAQREGPP